MSTLIYLNNKRAAARGSGYGLKLNGTNEYVQFYPRIGMPLQSNSPSALIHVCFMVHSLAATQCIWHFTADNVPAGGEYLLVNTDGSLTYGPSIDSQLRYIIPAGIQVGVLYTVSIFVPINGSDTRFYYPFFTMLVNNVAYSNGLGNVSPTGGGIGAGNNITTATRILLGARATGAGTQSMYSSATIYEFWLCGKIPNDAGTALALSHLRIIHNQGYGCDLRRITSPTPDNLATNPHKYLTYTLAHIKFNPANVSGTNTLTRMYCLNNTATLVNAASVPSTKFPTRRIGKNFITV